MGWMPTGIDEDQPLGSIEENAVPVRPAPIERHRAGNEVKRRRPGASRRGYGRQRQ
jgi:hypothetical protein